MDEVRTENADELFAVSDNLVTVAGRLMIVAQEISRLADQMESLERVRDEMCEVGSLP